MVTRTTCLGCPSWSLSKLDIVSVENFLCGSGEGRSPRTIICPRYPGTDNRTLIQGQTKISSLPRLINIREDCQTVWTPEMYQQHSPGLIRLACLNSTSLKTLCKTNRQNKKDDHGILTPSALVYPDICCIPVPSEQVNVHARANRRCIKTEGQQIFLRILLNYTCCGNHTCPRFRRKGKVPCASC